MIFNTKTEIEEVMVTIQGREHLVCLEVELEIDYTPPSQEVRGKDNSCLEPPSGADFKVIWAESTMELFNDDGEEIGKLVIKGVEFLESVIDTDKMIENMDLSEEDLY